ncbi:protein huluwa [Polymixia lowei]
MSQVAVTPSNLNLNEGYPITNLTLLVLSLIPCMVVLLLLNCLFLGYKLLIISRKKRKKREDTEEMLLHSTLSTRHRVTRVVDVPFFPNHDGRRPYMSMSEPILQQPVTSSRTSEVDQRTRFPRPDGATGTGSGSLRAPSTILATSTSGCTSRVDLPRSSRMYNKTGWCRSAPLLPQSSDSEVDTRANRVPNNSPVGDDPLSRQMALHVDPVRRSSRPPFELLTDVNHAAAHDVFDKIELECEYVSCNLPETSCLNASTAGPGLDSDFGASAGVSLRILSADSDGLSTGVLASALEWDYYDPCYVRQNNIPAHKHPRPAVHTKQYWV